MRFRQLAQITYAVTAMPLPDTTSYAVADHPVGGLLPVNTGRVDEITDTLPALFPVTSPPPPMACCPVPQDAVDVADAPTELLVSDWEVPVTTVIVLKLP